METARITVCPSTNCGVLIGDRHNRSCSIARCKEHGNQLIACDQNGIHTPSIYRGEFPGTTEAIERGWFARQVEGQGWVPCQIDHPDARPDLNRVMTELSWNQDSESFE